MKKQPTQLELWCLIIITSSKIGIDSELIALAEETLKNGAVQYLALGVELECEAVRIHNIVASRGQEEVEKANDVLNAHFFSVNEIKILLQNGFKSTCKTKWYNSYEKCSFFKERNPRVEFVDAFEYTTVFTLHNYEGGVFEAYIYTINDEGCSGTAVYCFEVPVNRLYEALMGFEQFIEQFESEKLKAHA